MYISFTKRKIHFVYIVLGAVSMLLALASYARAEETVTPPGGDRSVASQDAAQSRSTGLKEGLQNRFINLVRNVYNRMDAAITRLDGIAVRLESRITLLNAAGVDTSLAITPLKTAKSTLARARAELAQAKANAETGIISDSPREQFKAAREEFGSIRQIIREAYILLKETLAELKDAVLEFELNKRGASPAVTDTQANEIGNSGN